MCTVQSTHNGLTFLFSFLFCYYTQIDTLHLEIKHFILCAFVFFSFRFLHSKISIKCFVSIWNFRLNKKTTYTIDDTIIGVFVDYSPQIKCKLKQKTITFSVKLFLLIVFAFAPIKCTRGSWFDVSAVWNTVHNWQVSVCLIHTNRSNTVRMPHVPGAYVQACMR